jgi:hypothetical protein
MNVEQPCAGGGMVPLGARDIVQQGRGRRQFHVHRDPGRFEGLGQASGHH